MALELSPGEEVIFQGHPSWRTILGFYLKGVLIAVLLAAIVAAVTRVTGDEVDQPLVGTVFVAVVAITILAGFVKRVATTYTITTHRLNIKRGIIARKVQETRLERVQNVNFDQSVYQRVMQIGDVDFDTAAGDDYNFIFAGVAEPEDVVHQVNEATRVGGGPAGLGADERTDGPAER